MPQLFTPRRHHRSYQLPATPSGDPTPSPGDARVTEKIVEAGKLLEIDVLDHLVTGERNFVSLRERRLGFK